MVNGTLGTYGGGTTGISAAPLGWSSSCADLLKMVTNSTLIWGVTGPRENFNTVMVLFATLHCLLGSCQDAVAPVANERGVNIWAVVMAQHSKSIGYAV